MPLLQTSKEKEPFSGCGAGCLPFVVNPLHCIADMAVHTCTPSTYCIDDRPVHTYDPSIHHVADMTVHTCDSITQSIADCSAHL